MQCAPLPWGRQGARTGDTVQRGAAGYDAPVQPPAVAPRIAGTHALLASHLAVVVRGGVPAVTCASWAKGVLAAHEAWTADFGGEQFSLGRAFYTHLETDRAGEYFEDAAESDARVEEHAPGLQEALRRLVEEAVGGRVVAREGWCSAGVHVFTPDGPVAESGGVIHFDTEGLTEEHVARRAPALSLVVMLQPPLAGGGLRLWPALYAGQDHPDDAVVRAGGDALVEYAPGDVVLFDSYRLHQIQAFEGERLRISATLHAAEVDAGLWESWF